MVSKYLSLSLCVLLTSGTPAWAQAGAGQHKAGAPARLTRSGTAGSKPAQSQKQGPSTSHAAQAAPAPWKAEIDAANILWATSTQAYNQETKQFNQQVFNDVLSGVEQHLRRAADLAAKGGGPIDRSEIASRLAMCLITEKQFEEALDLYQQALNLRKQANPVDTVEVAECYDHIAMCKGFLQLQKETIIDDERSAYEIYSRLVPDDDVRLSGPCKMLAEYASSPAEAVPFRRQIVKIETKAYGDKAPGLIGAEMFVLAIALGNSGKLNEAIDQGNQAIEWTNRQSPNSPYAGYIQQTIDHWKRQLIGAEPAWNVVYHNKFAGRNPRSKTDDPNPPTIALGPPHIRHIASHVPHVGHIPYIGHVPHVGHHHHHHDYGSTEQSGQSAGSQPSDQMEQPSGQEQQPRPEETTAQEQPPERRQPPEQGQQPVTLQPPSETAEQPPMQQPLQPPTQVPPQTSVQPPPPPKVAEPAHRPSDDAGGAGRRFYVAGKEVGRDIYDAAMLSNEACELLARHKYDEARSKLSTAVSLDPNLSSAHANLGMALAKLGMMDDAVQQIKYAVQQEPDKSAPLSMLATTYQTSGRLDEAVATFKQYMEKFPGESDISVVRALVDSLEKVSQSQKDVIASNPGAATAGDYLAFITAQSKVRWKKSNGAIKVFIASGSGVKNFMPAFEKSMRQSFADWVAGTGGVVSIQYVGSKDDADVDCFFTDNYAQVSSLAEGGETKMLYDSTGTFKHCSIAILTAHATDNLPPGENEIRGVCLHEIGHSLGLTGHSPNAGDIMYCSETEFESKRPQLSARDLATLKKLYG